MKQPARTILCAFYFVDRKNENPNRGCNSADGQLRRRKGDIQRLHDRAERRCAHARRLKDRHKARNGASDFYKRRNDAVPFRGKQETADDQEHISKIVKPVDQPRQRVHKPLDPARVDGFRNKFRPCVFQLICLGFPARQHHADFLIRTSCRRSHLIKHFGVRVVIFNERVELVRAKLASKLCLDLGQLCLRQNAVSFLQSFLS